MFNVEYLDGDGVWVVHGEYKFNHAARIAACRLVEDIK